MTCVRVGFQVHEILYESGTKWVEMDIPHKLFQIGIFLT
jgi:hypothetical protein